MHECERLFGVSQGLAIQALVESATGGLCPCKRGLQCLLTPRVEPLAEHPAVAEAV
jgi:hypothetical protein